GDAPLARVHRLGDALGEGAVGAVETHGPDVDFAGRGSLGALEQVLAGVAHAVLGGDHGGPAAGLEHLAAVDRKLRGGTGVDHGEGAVAAADGVDAEVGAGAAGDQFEARGQVDPERKGGAGGGVQHGDGG